MTDEYFSGSQATAVIEHPSTASFYAWTPPPRWPRTPLGWFPPEGWAPPASWPTPPADWQWWQPATPPRPSSAGFHWGGVGLFVGAVFAYLWLDLVIAFGSVGCGSSPDAVPGRDLVVVVSSFAVLSVPMLWALRGARRGFAWAPWVAVSMLFAPIVFKIADSLYNNVSCFTF